MPRDISLDYEKELLAQIASYSRKIQAIYNDAIIDITLVASTVKVSGTIISLDTFPVLKKALQDAVNKMHSGIYTTIIKSVNQSWQLSNDKNDLISRNVTKGKQLSKSVSDLVYNPNAGALKAFISRKEKGFNLSDRVWNLVEPYKYELEAGVLDGIGKGKSAASMAKDLQQYLKEPDKLFRRVRDQKGTLRLSKAAQNYNPGTGVYRSSYKNALRFTRTETNIAYRSSDFERWKNQPFTKGIEVRLSNSHELFGKDICDFLKGKYPKDFKFTGWHPQCLCHAVPLLTTGEEYDKIEDYMLGISKIKPKIDNIQEPNAAFSNYLKDNKKEIKSWKNKPYWVKDNSKYVKGV